LARLNAFFGQWAIVIVFDVAVLMMLYTALKDRRISLGHDFFKSYYVERDKNPTGYWFVVALYVAAMLAIPVGFYSSGPHLSR
jgi:hypothetical protein